jgi:hypothetical protein
LFAAKKHALEVGFCVVVPTQLERAPKTFKSYYKAATNTIQKPIHFTIR